MNVIERARASGKCPPSLFRDEPKEDSFETAVAKVLDANDLILSSGGSFVDDFKALMQMTVSASDVPGDKDTQTAILAQRRCIILAIVGATPSSNSSMALILESGFLSTAKSWLDDILAGSVGGVDLLLHLLSNVIELPVTKSIVKESGMGKAIGSIEKHKICADSPNAVAVKERVAKIKSAWHKSVKALAEKTPAPKRESEPSQLDSHPVAKKARTEEKKPSSFSTLLKKVKPESNPVSEKSISSDVTEPTTNTTKNGGGVKTEKKKQSQRVKWQDHFGGDLTASRVIEGDEVKPEEKSTEEESSVSWSDRRKRDRLREKELLSKVKKSKLMDDDDDDMGMDALSAAPSRAISTTTAWKTPSLLPARADAPPPQVNSPEVATQTARMTNILRAQYISEYNVPSSPAPMSDVEQALDMTNQSSTVTQSIPFFVPQQLPEPVPAAPVPAPAVSYPPPANNWAAPPQPVVRPMESPPSAATPDFVQSLGLPMFLVGQDIQALQTLASTPSLLSTFVDSNGMYDQARLTSLVQTLSQNSKPKPQPQPVATGHMGAGGYQQPYQGGQNRYGGAPPGGGGIYGPASGGAYGPSSGSGAYGGGWQAGGPPKNGFREQKSSDGNLHVSGYGPATTQVDIINVFAPYVQVDEVVMKGTFSFVNTSDPPGAARAREALTGALIGGQPIRINVATRKKREDGPPPFGGAPPMASVYGGAGQSVPGLPSQPPPMMNQGGFPPPVAPPGNVDVNSVRDDRGNPATKNLFVAGYGPGTTEFQLRELFGQHAQILAIIVKGTFCFVNTSDRVDAVRARECLSGSMFNGGVLRINFAKESGRLGTSFDVTYNQAGGGGPGGHGGPGPPPGGGLSHYGRR